VRSISIAPSSEKIGPHFAPSGAATPVHRRAWVQIVVVGVLADSAHSGRTYTLVGKTNPFYGEPTGPRDLRSVIGLYYLYLHRSALRADAVRTACQACRSAWRDMLSGLAIWPYRTTSPRMWNGCVSVRRGAAAVRLGICALPGFRSCFICALPWPRCCTAGWPAAAAASANVASMFPVYRVQAMSSGTKILMEHGSFVRTLNVAEACAGMRSLMSSFPWPRPSHFSAPASLAEAGDRDLLRPMPFSAT